MPIFESSSGPIDYVDTGGPGPALVFGHGVPMNADQWGKVVPHLVGYRCLLPTWPLGAHRTPMRPEADLSHRGVARLIVEFCQGLGLSDVTLVLNDWGGGQFAVLDDPERRITRMVLVACEAFDNFPPPPARMLAKVARVPGGIWLLLQLLRTPMMRHGERGYGSMSLTRIPDQIWTRWLSPGLHSRAIRRDFAKFAVSAPESTTLLHWSEQCRSFDGPVLVVWAAKDLMMPADHGPRLAAHYPQGELVVIDDSRTLVPLDRPESLAAALLDFLRRTDTEPASGA